jgi:hypothetical protein
VGDRRHGIHEAGARAARSVVRSKREVQPRVPRRQGGAEADPQLGQAARALQEKATSRSWPHVSQWAREPCLQPAEWFPALVTGPACPRQF